MKKIISFVMAAVMAVSCFVFAPVNAAGNTPYSRYGNIKVVGNQLCDASGNPIQLRGMSTFGLQWGEGNWVLNDAAFDALAGDFMCDVVRLAMYVSEDGYASHPADMLARVEQGIQLATARGMYVIVDWHILSPGNPTDSVYLNAGKNLSEYASIRSAHPEYNGPQLFFAYLSQKYGSQGNILFETANEPNMSYDRNTAISNWRSVLRPYHQNIVNAIRDYDSDSNHNIIICGTDMWDQFVDTPLGNLITGDQIMYTIHFYAGTHDTNGNRWIEDMITSALDGGMAIFCTEWGTSEASGNGGPYLDNATRWLNFFADKGISWCAWSMARKNETSAALTTSSATNPTDTDGDGVPDWNNGGLTATGTYLRNKIREGKSYSAADPLDISTLPQTFVNANPAGVAGFVERLYLYTLDRSSDAAGKADWTNRMTNLGWTGAECAKGFLFSPEFTSKSISNSDFVEILYHTFFDRNSDAGGKDYWLNRMNGGLSRSGVIDGFINSVEWANLCLTYGIASGGTAAPNISVYASDSVTAFATRLYTTCLNRNYDQDGLDYWSLNLSNRRVTGTSVAYGFFFSAEFTSLGVSNEEYVTRLYRTFMGREPDAAGYADWVNQLYSGTSRKDVFYGFANSVEFNNLCNSYGIKR